MNPPQGCFSKFPPSFFSVHFASPANRPPVHQLLGWSQGQTTPSQHQAVTRSRGVGRGGRQPGRRISPAPLPLRILWSLLPIFQRNPKHNSPPSSQTATGSVPARSALPPSAWKLGFPVRGRLPVPPPKKKKKMKRKGGEVGGKMALLTFFLPPFFLSCFSPVLLSFSSFIPAWAR